MYFIRNYIEFAMRMISYQIYWSLKYKVRRSLALTDLNDIKREFKELLWQSFVYFGTFPVSTTLFLHVSLCIKCWVCQLNMLNFSLASFYGVSMRLCINKVPNFRLISLFCAKIIFRPVDFILWQILAVNSNSQIFYIFRAKRFHIYTAGEKYGIICRNTQKSWSSLKYTEKFTTRWIHHLYSSSCKFTQ